MFVNADNETNPSATTGTINGGAVFLGNSQNYGVVYGGAIFNDAGSTTVGIARNRQGGTVNGGAEFFGASGNAGGTVNGGADFYDSSENLRVGLFAPFIFGTVNDGAVFFDTSENGAIVNGGADFYDSSENLASGTVNGGAVFYDSACSRRFTGSVGPPCTRVFVAHPTDIPTCSGTAPAGCDDPADTCGCG